MTAGTITTMNDGIVSSFSGGTIGTLNQNATITNWNGGTVNNFNDANYGTWTSGRIVNMNS